MRKRWKMFLLAGVGLGVVLMLFVHTRPAVDAGIGSEAWLGGVERAEKHQAPGGAENGSPKCDLEAGYCPRRSQ